MFVFLSGILIFTVQHKRRLPWEKDVKKQSLNGAPTFLSWQDWIALLQGSMTWNAGEKHVVQMLLTSAINKATQILQGRLFIVPLSLQQVICCHIPCGWVLEVWLYTVQLKGICPLYKWVWFPTDDELSWIGWGEHIPWTCPSKPVTCSSDVSRTTFSLWPSTYQVPWISQQTWNPVTWRHQRSGCFKSARGFGYLPNRPQVTYATTEQLPIFRRTWLLLWCPTNAFVQMNQLVALGSWCVVSLLTLTPFWVPSYTAPWPSS